MYVLDTDIARTMTNDHRVLLPHRNSSVPAARTAVRAQLVLWGMNDQIDLAELLVSEIVTNAVCHGSGPVHLTLCAAAGVLHCEVSDQETAGPRPRPAGDSDESGRGIQLLQELSACWGCSPRGKKVWFEIPA